MSSHPRFPRVAGRCPGCHRETLFLGVGGHVTCSLICCSNPCAADDLLHGGAPPAGGAAVDAVSVSRQEPDDIPGYSDHVLAR